MKRVLVLLVAFTGFAVGLAVPAVAEQPKYYSMEDYFYTPTTVPQENQNGYYLENLDPNLKFNPDAVTYYPFEIYLPNEKFPASYRIHSNYGNETDACSSCHSIHSAVGPSLLQWYTVYETCMACHDGTVSTTYDVVRGEIRNGEDALPAYGGAFGGYGGKSEKSWSNHNVTGAITVAAAPGGSKQKEVTGLTRLGKELYRWDQEFSCQSCHSPHGQGGNARVLHPDPNFVQTVNHKKELMKLQLEEGVFVAKEGGDKLLMIIGYPYKVKVYKGYSPESATEIKDFNLSNQKGYSEITVPDGLLAPGENLYASFVPALRVEMEIDNYLTTDEVVIHKKGINDFCGACHTDYNTEGEEHPGSLSPNGVYSKAYRHAVGIPYDYNGSNPEGIGNGYSRSEWMKLEEGKITCLTCHLAHGTNEDYWERTIGDEKYMGDVLWAGTGSFVGAEIEELAGSSALKRLPNMGVCEACHEKGLANEGYLVNSGLKKPAQTALVQSSIFQPGGGYVKDNDDNHECYSCHQEYTTYQETVHWKEQQYRCEQCHGPGGNHVKLPADSNILNPAVDYSVSQQTDLVCGNCHQEGLLSDFHSSKHYLSQIVSCPTCHNSHGLNKEGEELKHPKGMLCAACHGEVMKYTDHSFPPE
ncbi:cytochrome c3 family protein [Calderihabitans maritimus]|uniref:cytochrome c3 family protein n=1 Tax=Calderihabitans maritimus TaxID=1246530 RepID=UPI000B504D3E|nr:cytochrome c3 family protein [Calderihabitans maritimus]